MRSVVDWSRFYRYARNEAVRVPFADGRTASTGTGRRRAVRSSATGRATQVIETSGRMSERTITIASRATMTLSDVASSSGTETAHVVITPQRGELVATARSSGGSAIPVLAASAGLRLGQSQLFSALDDSAATRTSYGLVETAGTGAKVRAEIILEQADAKVAAVTSRTFTLAPREQLLVPELVRSFAGDARDTLFGDLHGLVLSLEVIEGAGAVVPFVMETDRATGDVTVRID